MSIMKSVYDGEPVDGEPAEEHGSEAESEAVTRDRVLYAGLRTVGFAGPLYDVWAGQMWTYAIRILTGWLRSGEISEQCARRRIRISINSVELEIFERNEEVRSTLAIETVMSAGPDFRKAALCEGGWDPDKGACIFTYFVGRCLFAFRDVFKKWSRQRKRRLAEVAEGLGGLVETPARGAGADPFRRIAFKDTLERILAEATPVAVAICLLAYTEPDLTYKQIGVRLGGMTSRAVEGQLHRLKATAHRLAREGKIDYPGPWGAGR
ncbi:hypothetical protein [Streptomyces sp. GbtcB6]|uniref:hypothetical protein n=1 Tax=Streptomyces sp. GbtcB6 TaxID=2824751 RepID=UPI001C30C63F|nr:hypothetical protein [Streptomyces sp. GbtcB6]